MVNIMAKVFVTLLVVVSIIPKSTNAQGIAELEGPAGAFGKVYGPVFGPDGVAKTATKGLSAGLDGAVFILGDLAAESG